jgi:hypothetical protein
LFFEFNIFSFKKGLSVKLDTVMSPQQARE